MSNISIIEQDIYGTKDSFMSVLADRSINFEREAGFAIQVLQASEYAQKIAIGNRQSVVDAVVNIAAIGISLNPAKRQAYLVPRKNKICLDISYMGLMDLAIESGSIKWAQAELVCQNDSFALNGFDKPPSHAYNPFDGNRGEVVGGYVVVKTADGDYLTTCMSREEIDGIMNRSESMKSGNSSPWKTDWREMAKKTIVKRAYKYWPKSDRLDQAIHHLNTDSGEGLATLAVQQQPQQRGALPPPTDSPERDALYASLQDIATAGLRAYGEAWAKLTKEQRTMIGQAAHELLKAQAEKASAEVME